MIESELYHQNYLGFKVLFQDFETKKRNKRLYKIHALEKKFTLLPKIKYMMIKIVKTNLMKLPTQRAMTVKFKVTKIR